MSVIDAVIFDLDGLLLDTEALSRRGWQWALARWGYSLSEDNYEPVIGRSVSDTCEIWLELFGEECPVWEANELRLRYIQEHLDHSGDLVKNGGKQILSYLERNNIPVAVATSSSGDLAKQKLRLSGLDQFIQVVVSGDQVAHGKPHPDIYLETSRRLGSKPAACLAFEDSDDGVTAAVRAGIPVVMIPDLIAPSSASQDSAIAILRNLMEGLAFLQEFRLGTSPAAAS